MIPGWLLNRLALMLVIAAGFLTVQAGQAKTIVVCPRSFRAALTPWCKYRKSQGYRLQFVTPVGTAEKMRAAILRAKGDSPVEAILLVGDAPAYQEQGEPAIASNQIPAFYHRAQVNILFGSEPEIASDADYCDLDGDGTPDVAIGRLPVQNSEQLSQVVQRIIDYETKYANSLQKRQVHFIAGVGGFGPLVDGLLDTVSRRLIGGGIPGSLDVSMTYASWTSPYCPPPREFGKYTIDRLNQGGLFWIYMGHGLRYQLDSVHVPGFRPIPIYQSSDSAKLSVTGLPPICVFLACYAGAFDSPRPSVGEQMLLAEKGPVAVLAASRVTMPYAMSVMGDSMLRQAFQHRRETLGEIVLVAKQELTADRDAAGLSVNRALLDRVAALMSPRADLLQEERREHALLFNLLGDPLLRIHYPDGMQVKCLPAIVDGDHVLVQFTAPFPGDAVVEIVTQRGYQRKELLPRKVLEPTSPGWKRFSEEYKAANDPVWVARHFPVESGLQTIEIPVAGIRAGLQVVRVVIQGKSQLVVGSARIFIK